MVWLFSILPTFTAIKIGGLQAEDFALLALLAFCAAHWFGFQAKDRSESRSAVPRIRLAPSVPFLFPGIGVENADFPP